MLRYVSEPVDAGGFERDIRVEAAGHGPVDDDLLLLVQELDQPPLGADESVDATIESFDEADDSLLLFVRRHRESDFVEVVRIESPESFNNALGALPKLNATRGGSKDGVEVRWGELPAAGASNWRSTATWVATAGSFVLGRSSWFNATPTSVA